MEYLVMNMQRYEQEEFSSEIEHTIPYEEEAQVLLFKRVFWGVLSGMVLWTVATLMYAGWIGAPALPITVTGYIFIIIGYFVLWLAAGIFSIFGSDIMNGIAFALYLGASWVTGIIASVAVRYVAIDTQLPMNEIQLIFTVAMIVAALSVVAAVGTGYLEAKNGGSINLMYSIGIIGILVILTEFIMFFLAPSMEWYVYIVDPIVIIWAYFGVKADGMRMAMKHADRGWMNFVINIFLGLVIILLRIFRLLAYLARASR
jgi:hypothetical protein